MMSLTEYNLTPKAKKAIRDAKLFAEANNHGRVRNEHLIYGCLINLSDRNILLFESRGVVYEPRDFIKTFKKFCKKNPEFFLKRKNENSWHDELNSTILESKFFAETHDDHFVGVEHLLYILLDTKSNFKKDLEDSGLETDYFKDVIEEIIVDSNPVVSNSSSSNVFSESPKEKSSSYSQKEDEEVVPENLLKYCVNMNQEMFMKDFPPIVSRDEEIESVIEILSKKNKSNSILVGGAGVGKTAIVEGLAQRIMVDQVPSHMSMCQIYSVDIAGMLAGTQYRGQFEERFKGLLKEVEGKDNIILFFDEIHTVIGAGNSSEGNMDASNMLKPALARGSIKCIGATTAKEYKKIFEKDGALKRRFDKVDVHEPSKEQTRNMLNQALPYYQDFHGVKFSKANIDKILDNCEIYLSNKKFPDKAFDVVDQIGARTKIKSDNPPDYVVEAKKKFSDMITKPCENEEDFVDTMEDYIKSISKYNDTAKKKVSISNADILEVFESKTGVSKKIIGETNFRFSLFKDKMKKEIFGQDRIIDDIYDNLSCVKVGLNDPDKPLSNFLFVGPTSVGKTFTAKNIAKNFYGSDRSFIQINMSEYQDKTGISKLIGANAGYVGYEEGGILTEFVRNNPNCVVLFDEIEKADPKILDILLHLLDEGYVSDNLNRKIDFSKSIVILTTNIGHQQTGAKSVGFVDDSPSDDFVYEDSLKKSLRPELIARINNTYVFDALTDDVMMSIVSKEISFIAERLREKNISMQTRKTVHKFILNKIKTEKLHARNVKVIVKKLLQTPIARFVIENKNVEKISLKVVDKNIKVS